MNYSNMDVAKRNLYNKLENMVRTVKLSINVKNTPEERKKLIKKIGLIIAAFQIDLLYSQLTDVSGIASLLSIFGLPTSFATKIKNLGYSSVSIATLAVMIYKFLNENQISNFNNTLTHTLNK